MNILAASISKISSVYPAQTITIYNSYSELVNGKDFKNEVTITTTANIQQLKASEVKDFVTYSDSFDYRRFYILGKNANLVCSALSQSITNSKIYLNNIVYNVYYREDWSNNGWILVEGVASEFDNK